MSVLALGLSRTGTNSLRTALLHLGYNDCYHGFSLISGDGWRDGIAWNQLLIRKFRPSTYDAPLQVTAAQFDWILGNSMALTDIPAVLFAGELLDAYPGAAVILNRRSDTQEWKKSFRATTLAAERNWVIWVCSFFDAELFWMERVFIIAIQALFGGSFEANAEHAYRDHYEKLEEKLKATKRPYLDWEARDGWGPLCEFLGRQVPDIEFPEENKRDAHDMNIERLMEKKVRAAMFRLALCVTCLVAIMLAFWWGTVGIHSSRH